MPNIIEILARAQSLMNETALNSITPPRAGGIMYDTLLVLNQMQLEGSSLLISKVYSSVSAMESDTTPTSDLTGRALKPGQLVVIVTSDTSSSDMGSEYRYNGPGSWTYVGKVGGLPLDTVPTEGSTKGVTSGGVYADINNLNGGKVSKVFDSVDLSTEEKYNYSILTTGKYGTNTSYKHFRLPADNVTAIRVTSNSSYGARYAFLSSAASPTSGGDIPVVPGTSVASLSAGETKVIQVPDGTVIIAIYAGQGEAYAYTPSAVSLGGLVVDRLDSSSTKHALSANQGRNLAARTQIDYREVNLKALDLRNARINSSLQWNNTSRYRHVIVPVLIGETIIVKANGNENASLAFLYEAGTPTNNTDAPVVPDTSLEAIPAGTSAEFTVPAGCAYVYLYSGDLNSGSSHKWDGLPDSFTAYGTLSSVSKKTNENSAALTELKIPKATIKTQFVGADNTQVMTERIYDFAPGQSYRCVILNPNVSLSDTSGNNYRFQLRAYDAEGNTIETMVQYSTARSLPDYVDFVVPSGTAYIRVLGRAIADAVFPVMFFPIASSVMSRGILDLNPESEFRPKFMSAQKRYYTSTTNDKPNPLVLLHLSDIHGNWANVARYLEFAKKYTSYIDVLLNTGDTVESDYDDGVDGYLALDGVDKVLVAIGNHDTRSGSDASDWQAHIGTDAYNLLIKPSVSEWGVTQPAGAEENGYCYYYKDFAAKKLRLIVVDIMAYDSTQDAWLESVLASALTSELHCVIATHFSGARPYAEREEGVFEKLSCNYTTLYSLGTTSEQLTGYNANAYLMGATVDAFIEAGGHFVGYIQGHYHADFVAKLDVYPEQLIYSIGASKAGEMRDFNHVVGTRDQDEFQIIAIDTVNTIVKLYKVGAYYDRYGRSKGSVCVNYTTGEVLGEGL